MLHDLLLKGGSVMLPGSLEPRVIDIAIEEGTIVSISEGIDERDGVASIDCRGKYVSAGFIDLHTHVSGSLTTHGVSPDVAGVLQGVTTVADAGSLGARGISQFLDNVAASTTTVMTFVNIARHGQTINPELREPADIEDATLREALRKHSAQLSGIKIRLVSPVVDMLGADLVDIAVGYAREIGGRVMMHVGDHGESDHADDVTRDAIRRLRPGDILTHVFTPYPGGPTNHQGVVWDEVLEACDRGVVIDAARGAMNFSIARAKACLETGFRPHTISSDLTQMTVRGPVFGLPNVASIFLNLGMSLGEVIACITIAPAAALGIADSAGEVRVGRPADLTVFELRRDRAVTFQGFRDEVFEGHQEILPTFTIAKGVVICPIISRRAVSSDTEAGAG